MCERSGGSGERNQECNAVVVENTGILLKIVQLWPWGHWPLRCSPLYPTRLSAVLFFKNLIVLTPQNCSVVKYRIRNIKKCTLKWTLANELPKCWSAIFVPHMGNTRFSVAEMTSGELALEIELFLLIVSWPCQKTGPNWLQVAHFSRGTSGQWRFSAFLNSTLNLCSSSYSKDIKTIQSYSSLWGRTRIPSLSGFIMEQHKYRIIGWPHHETAHIYHWVIGWPHYETTHVPHQWVPS